MQNIILDLDSPNGKLLDLSALYQKLKHLTDTRSSHGKVYPLEFVLILIILAKFSGQNKPSGIAEWIKCRCNILVKLLHFKTNRVPCLNTIRTILSDVISLNELEKLLQEYLLDRYGGYQSELVAIDGKTLRGTIPQGQTRGLHLLTAYLPEEGVVLAQIPVDEKKNEISMAPQLLKQLNLKGKVVCGDAMLTQRTISTDILGAGGHYLWSLKENQPTVMNDVIQFFRPPRKAPGWHAESLSYQSATMTNKGHGRLEKRRMTVTTDVNQFVDWPGLSQVFKLERTVKDLSRDTVSKETVYGITSCPASSHSANDLLLLARSYWGIENGLHYRRDVTLQEDQTRVSNSQLATAIATLNNFVVGLIKKLAFDNLASALRRFDASLNSLIIHSAR